MAGEEDLESERKQHTQGVVKSSAAMVGGKMAGGVEEGVKQSCRG